MQIDLSGRVPLEGDAVDGDGDGVRRMPVDLLRRRRGRQLGLAPRGLEHVLRVVKDLSQIGLFLFLKHLVARSISKLQLVKVTHINWIYPASSSGFTCYFRYYN